MIQNSHIQKVLTVLIIFVALFYLRGRVSFSIKWFDLWVGAYVDVDRRRVYVCPIPCCVFEIR